MPSMASSTFVATWNASHQKKGRLFRTCDQLEHETSGISMFLTSIKSGPLFPTHTADTNASRDDVPWVEKPWTKKTCTRRQRRNKVVTSHECPLHQAKGLQTSRPPRLLLRMLHRKRYRCAGRGHTANAVEMQRQRNSGYTFLRISRRVASAAGFFLPSTFSAATK